MGDPVVDESSHFRKIENLQLTCQHCTFHSSTKRFKNLNYYLQCLPIKSTKKLSRQKNIFEISEWSHRKKNFSLKNIVNKPEKSSSVKVKPRGKFFVWQTKTRQFFKKLMLMSNCLFLIVLHPGPPSVLFMTFFIYALGSMY